MEKINTKFNVYSFTVAVIKKKKHFGQKSSRTSNKLNKFRCNQHNQHRVIQSHIKHPMAFITNYIDEFEGLLYDPCLI